MKNSKKILEKAINSLIDLNNTYDIKASRKHEQQHREMKRLIDWNSIDETLTHLEKTLLNISGEKIKLYKRVR